MTEKQPTKPKGRGKGKKPAKQVTSVALDDDLIQALTERAEREERTVSALIRLAIKYYLECVK
ncbi:MAG: ribbon-helix-helix domain-containing protein [Methylomonas sp.]|jgi:metal-responsive CopG/Arc/MetJ family transcriptional regulator|uniref:ribbon-helix-helix domain-containing protein n=1 Tax=Methylomonas sp. TaxID=418 RepID=UPI0025FFDED5|nr:ribbon-helix-helix domain-containing protein [Methylomonas sp.]MCK9606697.1 ribbon-helix-helix domain-containing protein [Methylomonas sp.]